MFFWALLGCFWGVCCVFLVCFWDVGGNAFLFCLSCFWVCVHVFFWGGIGRVTYHCSASLRPTAKEVVGRGGGMDQQIHVTGL